MSFLLLTLVGGGGVARRGGDEGRGGEGRASGSRCANPGRYKGGKTSQVRLTAYLPHPASRVGPIVPTFRVLIEDVINYGVDALPYHRHQIVKRTVQLIVSVFYTLPPFPGGRRALSGF